MYSVCVTKKFSGKDKLRVFNSYSTCSISIRDVDTGGTVVVDQQQCIYRLLQKFSHTLFCKKGMVSIDVDVVQILKSYARYIIKIKFWIRYV